MALGCVQEVHDTHQHPFGLPNGRRAAMVRVVALPVQHSKVVVTDHHIPGIFPGGKVGVGVLAFRIRPTLLIPLAPDQLVGLDDVDADGVGHRVYHNRHRTGAVVLVGLGEVVNRHRAATAYYLNLTEWGIDGSPRISWTCVSHCRLSSPWLSVASHCEPHASMAYSTTPIRGWPPIETG